MSLSLRGDYRYLCFPYINTSAGRTKECALGVFPSCCGLTLMVRLILSTFIYTEGEGATESRVGSREKGGRGEGRGNQGETGRGGAVVVLRGWRESLVSLREVLGINFTASALWIQRSGLQYPEIVTSFTRG